MNDKIIKILDESIKLELNISDLYLVFHEKIPEDSKFWWQLLLEEKNHAALLKTGKEVYLTKEDFPGEIISSTLETLIDSNKKISAYIKKFRNKKTIHREEALKIAYELEESAGEIHFQKSMGIKNSSALLRIFQDLNYQDKNHAERIKKYAQNNELNIIDEGK